MIIGYLNISKYKIFYKLFFLCINNNIYNIKYKQKNLNIGLNHVNN